MGATLVGIDAAAGRRDDLERRGMRGEPAPADVPAEAQTIEVFRVVVDDAARQ